MTTAYRREPCGHEKQGVFCVDPDKPQRWSEGHLADFTSLVCDGTAYVPWPELTKQLDAIAGISQYAHERSEIGRMTKGLKDINRIARTALTNLRSQG